jgi:predicted dehydrogenase
MLRVAIVGGGLIGGKRAREVVRAPDTRLIAVVDKNLERAQALAQQYECRAQADWTTVTSSPEIDVVVVATTHQWLAPITIDALKHHKHVLCEKPLAMNAEQAEELVKCAASNGSWLKTGFNHRYHPAVWKANSLACSGQIGRILHIRCRYGHGGRMGYDREWRADVQQSGGGELLDQGVHAFDLFRWFLGSFQDIYAVLSNAFWQMPVEDNAFCTLTTPTGQVASLHASWTQWKNLFSFEVFGTNGYLIAEGLGGSYGTERLIVGKRAAQFGKPEEHVLEYAGEDCSWSAEWKDFITAIRASRPPLADGYDGWQALRLVQAAYASARERRAISLT